MIDVTLGLVLVIPREQHHFQSLRVFVAITCTRSHEPIKIKNLEEFRKKNASSQSGGAFYAFFRITRRVIDLMQVACAFGFTYCCSCRHLSCRMAQGLSYPVTIKNTLLI